MKKYSYVKKIISVTSLKAIVEELKNNKKVIVFTNGCFDIIHCGHVDYLRKSRLKGDCLIVGINSDSSTRQLKGETRPINDLASRELILEAFDFVDYIVAFDDLTPYNLIQIIQPNVYTKGGDYNLSNVIGPGLGEEVITELGGEVCLIPITHNVSSTRMIERKNNE